MKVFIASDHAGFDMKTFLITNAPQVDWVDLGPSSNTSTDYPDWADKLANEVTAGKGMGVLVCGSGIGMCIRANRYPKVRAAMAWDLVSARLSREHNDANVVCLGSRLIPSGLCLEIINEFLNSKFAGGRHEGRVEKLGQPIK